MKPNKLWQNYFEILLFTNPGFRTKPGIEYRMDQNSIHIVNNDLFQHFIDENEENAWKFVREVKDHFKRENNRNLKISDRSLVVEIYAHIFPDKIADLIPFGIGDIIQEKTEVIDCGEEGFDSNRFLWDFIADFWENSLEE